VKSYKLLSQYKTEIEKKSFSTETSHHNSSSKQTADKYHEQQTTMLAACRELYDLTTTAECTLSSVRNIRI